MLTDEGIDLFSKPADAADLTPTLPNGRSPRGLTSRGWVRTTGWLQIGDHPVSSAHLAAVVGLMWSAVGAAVLVNRFPVLAGVLVLTAPAVCGVSWWLLTTYVRPASTARNIGTKQADELSPGDLVRLYGSIGPVGQVTAVAFGRDFEVVFRGGSHLSWPRDKVVHVAELIS